MTLALLVVSYNTRDKLERLVNTLWNGTKAYDRNWRLYIADNGSIDSSVQYLHSIDGGPLVDHIFYNTNIGYAAAINDMASKTSEDILGALNADVWLTDQDAKAIEQTFIDHPDQAIMGPKQRDEIGRITHGGIFGDLWAPQHRAWHSYDSEDTFFRDRNRALTVSGSAYFIRRAAWDILSSCAIYCAEEVVANSSVAVGAFLPTPHYY